MSSASLSDVKLEIGHVLFIDIVGYSKLLITEQTNQLQTLREIVRGTEQFKKADAEGKLLRLPTGDGGALVFRNSLEAPVLCALEISKALKSHPEMQVRMGIHSGPVNEITDLNEQANIAGVGINMAQRVMDCGDAGHILLSKRVADDLEQYPQWRSHLSDLGECEVKHGTRVSVVNLYTDDAGNRVAPQKFSKQSATAPLSGSMPRRDSKFALIAAGALVLVIVGGGLWFLSRQKGTPRSTSTSSSMSVVAAIPEKSIAVLPFDNLSDDKSNVYFAEGIQDEILTRLAKIAALKVISRTSTQKYKSAPDNSREVGQQLGVANLLEGSVQKVANAVHVNVQLIRAATDEHVWAESYNRKLDDVFGVEGEVATAIADQLNAKLSGTEQKAVTDKPTQNTAAYDAYLRGLSIERNRYSVRDYQNAANAYSQAVELDPKFALASARLAVIRSFLYFNSVDRSMNTRQAVQEAADRAMALAPEAGESWTAKGAYLYRVLRDFEGSVAAYQEAQRRLPNNSFVLQNLAFVQRRVGRWQEAEASFTKALALDPLDVRLLSSVGYEFYNYLRRFDQAHAFIDRALAIAPDSETAHAGKAGILQSEGRLAEAAQELARIPEDSTDDFVADSRVTQALYERDFNGVVRVVERKLNAIPSAQSLDAYDENALAKLGYCQEWTGRHSEAQQSFNRAIVSIKPTADTVVAPDANNLPSTLALAYAGLGQKQKAFEQAQQAVKDYETDAVNKPAAEAVLAQIQARFGDFDSAIAALPHLLEVPAGPTVADLKFNPLWDPLRGDPRFEKIVASLAPK